MSIGAILVGLAGLLVAAAYVARPFRPEPDSALLIDAWVARARRQEQLATATCPSCGSDVDPQDRFCRTCGGPLGDAPDPQVAERGGSQ